MVEVASRDSRMKTPTEGVCDTFKEVFTLFGQCHRVYNSKVVNDTTIDELGKHYKHAIKYVQYQFSLSEKNIETFIEVYRTRFPHATVTPKMHLLEDHIIPWLRKWHVGAGLMGEQGAESIHSHVKKLEMTHASIPKPLDRLRYIFKMYMIETNPSLLSIKPDIKRRKKREKAPSSSSSSSEQDSS